MQRSLPFLIWVISLGDMLPFRYLLRISYPPLRLAKPNGKIPFSLVLKMHFLACFPCDFRQDASFFEISQQDRVRQRINAYLPVAGSLRFRLPGRGCYRTESSRKMSLYRFKRIRDILRLLKLHRQGDDVPSLSDAEIVS